MIAKEKITKEMEEKKNPTIDRIGNYLIGLLPSVGAEEKILIEDKTLQGSHDAMKKIAREKAVKGSATFTDEEGFNIVREYYGIEIKQGITSDVDSLFG